MLDFSLETPWMKSVCKVLIPNKRIKCMRHARARAWVMSWCVLICMNVLFFNHTPPCSLYNLSLCVPLICVCLCAHVCSCAGARGRAVPQWMRPVRVEGRVLVHLHYQHGGRPASLRGGGPKPQDQVSERVSAGRLRAWHRNTIWEEKTGNRHWHTHWPWHWHREGKTNSEHTLLLTTECYLIFYFISCGAQKDIEINGSMLTFYAHRWNGSDRGSFLKSNKTEPWFEATAIDPQDLFFLCECGLVFSLLKGWGNLC